MSMSFYIPSDYQPATEQLGSISRKDLVASLSDKGVFDKLYIGLTNRAIHMYQKCGRRRSALKLHLAIAAFEQNQARDQHAQRLFAHLPAHYVDDRWTVIESSLLDRCASLQSRLGMSKELLLSTLALVRSGVSYEPGKWSQNVMLRDGQTDTAALALRLMTDIKEQASKLEKDFAAIAFPTFAIAVVGDAGRSADPKEGSILTACVTNHLPCVSQHLRSICSLRHTVSKLSFMFLTVCGSRCVAYEIFGRALRNAMVHNWYSNFAAG